MPARVTHQHQLGLLDPEDLLEQGDLGPADPKRQRYRNRRPDLELDGEHPLAEGGLGVVLEPGRPAVQGPERQPREDIGSA